MLVGAQVKGTWQLRFLLVPRGSAGVRTLWSQHHCSPCPPQVLVVSGAGMPVGPGRARCQRQSPAHTLPGRGVLLLPTSPVDFVSAPW